MKKILMALCAMFLMLGHSVAQDEEVLMDVDYVSMSPDAQFVRTSELGGVIRLFGTAKKSGNLMLHMRMDTADTMVYVRIAPYTPAPKAVPGLIQLVPLSTTSTLWQPLAAEFSTSKNYGSAELHVPKQYTSQRFWIEVYVSNLKEASFLVAESSSAENELVSWVKRDMLKTQTVTAAMLSQIPPYGEVFTRAAEKDPDLGLAKYNEFKELHGTLRFLVAVKEVVQIPETVSSTLSYVTNLKERGSDPLLKWIGIGVGVLIVLCVAFVMFWIWKPEFLTRRKREEHTVIGSVIISAAPGAHLPTRTVIPSGRPTEHASPEGSAEEVHAESTPQIVLRLDPAVLAALLQQQQSAVNSQADERPRGTALKTPVPKLVPRVRPPLEEM